MDKSIELFSQRMQFKLDKNKYKDCSVMNPDGKGRQWCEERCSISWLLFRLRQEMMKLEEVFVENPSDLEKMMNETADVGNFAMMIFDKLNQKFIKHG